jgi:hypothetical protein
LTAGTTIAIILAVVCSVDTGIVTATGVNIKVKSNPLIQPTILKIEYINNELVKSYASFEEYTKLLDKKKETKKDKHHTFLVFSSGSVIMSSRGSGMKEIYDDIVDIFTNNRQHFEMTTDEREPWMDLENDWDVSEKEEDF